MNVSMKYSLTRSLATIFGYCNVGNFGSDDRMDYTIIGAEAFGVEP